MGVMMQAFYWDCPGRERRDGAWWQFVESQVGELADAGFTALWLPPQSKAANSFGPSMGYDPYDYYDLGDYDQKGRTKTWFGNGQELRSLIRTAHRRAMQVYCDFVPNHNSGADAAEDNPIDGRSRWTKFTPKSARFPRDWRCFHPSPYETFDGMTFGDMPDLCHRNPYVYTQLIELAQWLVEDVGFDGFRFDFVKGYGPWMVKAIAEVRYLDKDQRGFKPFCVGECWDGERTIDDWLRTVNTFMDNPLSAFDFPLRYRLKDLCDSYGFDMRSLAAPGTVSHGDPWHAVTFVDNHDTTQKGEDAVIHDKMLAYAYILTHEGYPCVFWLDYFNYGLADRIRPLVRAHERYAGGSTGVLYADHDLYVMQRSGDGEQPGLVVVMNNRGEWNGTRVQTKWRNTRLTPIAWDGYDRSEPSAKWTSGEGDTDLWAAPRGYCVYVPAV